MEKVVNNRLLNFTAMRWKALLVIFCVMTSAGFAQMTYYVASTGNDANDGRSAAKPLQTLAKVNTLSLAPGDVVLFRRGDTFQGTLSISKSGTASKPIRFDAFGTGKKPLLVGSVPVKNWINLGNNRWQASCSECGDRLTGLYLNGSALPLGRYPNADAPNRGNLTVESATGINQLTVQEPLTTDWTGAEIVLFPTYWIIDRAVIKQQTGNALLLDNPSTYPITPQWPCFIQNHPATLDRQGEWAYNPTTKTIQLYADQLNPNEQTIRATTTDRGIDIASASFVTIRNLHVAQSRVTNLYASDVSNLTLIQNEFTEAGEDGVTIRGTGNTILVDSSSIVNCNNNGFLIGTYQDVTVRNSTIRNAGAVAGRGKGGDGQYTGLQSLATKNTLIENNIIDSIGYNGITVLDSSIIRRNQIANFCMVKGDGGGIYVFNANQLPLNDIRIESNIIQQGIGIYGGVPAKTLTSAHGIFLDGCVHNVDMTDNTIFNCHGMGILMFSPNHVNVLRNTSFNNSTNQLLIYNYNALCLPRNNVLKQNVLISKTIAQPVAGYISGTDDIQQFGLMEQNYYARPFNDLSTIGAVYNSNIVDSLNLTQWQTQFGHDINSHKSPIDYKGYRVKRVSTTSLLQNSFDKTTEGWVDWSPNNNSQLTWQNSPLLDKGSLKINVPDVSNQKGSYVLLLKGIPAVTKGQTYLIQFDAASPVNKRMVVYIRQRGGPFQDITERHEFISGPVRQRYEFALTVAISEAEPLLSFQLRDESQPVWFDNIQLREATIEQVNPDEFIKLVYNPTLRDSVVVLGESYRDVKNHYYANQLVLKPFTSVVLLRDTLPPVDVRLSLTSSRRLIKVNDVVAVTLSLTNESVGQKVVASRVQWSCRLPPNLSPVNLNGLVYKDSVLTGTVQQLRTDTTFAFQLKATATGSYTLAAEVIEATFADPNSTPASGTSDGENDTAQITLLVSARSATDTTAQVDTTTKIITANEPVLPVTSENAVYPNPASDEFTFTAEADISAIRLIDLLGRERLMLDPVRQGRTIRFGNDLPDGLYLVYIEYKTGTKRVVKVLKR